MRPATRSRLAGLCLALVVAGTASASAQTLLGGYYYPIFHEDQEERVRGSAVGDYLGLPINDDLRLRADTWDASLLTVPEHQCKPHPSTYGFRGVGQLRIWEDFDPLTQRLLKINTLIEWQEQRREIWMDGRSHPPEYARHTWQGFSTGRFENDVLVVETTHLKAGWIRRNGLALSDRATMVERFVRHGDLLTHVTLIQDPVYLTEPLVRTNGFQSIPNGGIEPYPCQPVVEVVRPRGQVPHHPLGQNGFLHEFAERYGIPFEASRGGAETALPDYEIRLKALVTNGAEK